MKIETDKKSYVFQNLSKQVVGDMRMRAEQRELKHADLAEILGVDRSAISKTMNGDTNLTLKKIADIAAATGSKCFFRMTPDYDHFEQRQAISMVENEDPFAIQKVQKHVGRGLSLKGLMQEAEKYIRDIAHERKFVWEDDVHVSIKPDINEFFLGDEGAANRDVEPFIHVFPDDEDKYPDAEVCIKVEYKFADGFAGVEWVLVDTELNEHFRSRDLRQVAQLALLVLSRDGFRN